MGIRLNTTPLCALIMKAKDYFDNQVKGILSQIQVLDIYFLNLINIIRKQPAESGAIKNIIDASLISGYNLLETLYTQEEFEYFEKNEKIKYAGQHILYSIYTAIENYFIEKFREYFIYKLANTDNKLTERILKNISFRSLKEIKNNYSDYLDIHLPFFDVDYLTQAKCNFHPKNSWEGLLLLSDIRNDVAHNGMTDKYKISTLMDCWYPFEFVRNYIMYFDTSFDELFYQGRKTRLIQLYQENINKRI